MMQHILKQEAGLQEACSSCDERAKFTASSAAALLALRRHRVVKAYACVADTIDVLCAWDLTGRADPLF